MSVLNDSIIGALREYFLSCPYLKDGKFSVDFLPNDTSYSIDPLPSDPIYRRYVDGGKIYQLEYTFTSKEAYDGNTRTMIDNSFFYQQLSEWVEKQEETGNLPELEGYHAISNVVTSSGYLFDADSDLAKYQVQLRLLYE